MGAITNKLIPGLSEKDCMYIRNILEKFQEVQKAVVFGSRAKGNFKNGSDVDIAIKGNNIDSQIVKRIKYELNEEIPLPWFFDVIHYEKLKNNELKEHIDRIGMVFYSNDKS